MSISAFGFKILNSHISQDVAAFAVLTVVLATVQSYPLLSGYGGYGGDNGGYGGTGGDQVGKQEHQLLRPAVDYHVSSNRRITSLWA